MRPIAEDVLRASFINASKGEAARMNLPRDFAETDWSELDFLGWHDPGARERAWLVAERDGRVVGLSLRVAAAGVRGFTARSMCSVCLTTRTGGGVTLMSARKTGAAGRRGNTVGQYLCGDLACSLYVRGRKQAAGAQFEEAMTVEDKIARLRLNLEAFLDKVAE